MRFVCFALALTACGGSNGPSVGSGGGALTIAVDQVTQPSAIGSVQPSSGRRFVEVGAALANGSDSVQSIAFALFALRTVSGLQIQASADTALLSQACGADQSLAPGGNTMCALAFEVPTAETPTTLVWLDPKTMLTSTASLPPIMASPLVTSCEQVLAFKRLNTQACDTCIQTCKVSSDACTQAESNCAAACAMNNAGTDGACTCIDHCAMSAACRQAGVDEYQCIAQQCNASCN